LTARLHVAIVSVNDALFDGPIGDDADVLRALGRHVGRLWVVVATPRERSEIALADNVTVLPASAPSRSIGLRSLVRTVRLIHARSELDLIQAQEPFFTGLASLVGARYTGAALVVGVFGADPRDPHFRATSVGHRAASPLGSYVIKRATAVQTDSLVIAESMRARGVRVRYKPMTPLNLGWFLRHGENRVYRDPASSILFVGRLGRQKRLRLLIDAFSRLCQSRLAAKLVVIGEGPDRICLERHAAAQGVGHAVIFHGAVPHEELPRAYLEADVLALASRYEGMPRVFLEGGATGLPIVSTPVAGAVELATDAPIRLADPSTGGLASALGEMLCDVQRRRAAGWALRRLMTRRATERPPVERQLEIWQELAG
jgi:glycosyltransferase involved in cell wall biosynthesis